MSYNYATTSEPAMHVISSRPLEEKYAKSRGLVETTETAEQFEDRRFAETVAKMDSER